MYWELAKELRKNTEIMEASFNKFNLKVIQIAYQPYGIEGDDDKDGDCDCLVEITTFDGGPMTDDAYIKVNLYDENSELIYHEDTLVFSDEFSGYDTYKISLSNDKNTLFKSKTARVYMSAGN